MSDCHEPQGYLGAAPGGVDAYYAWTLDGGHGKGVGFVDVEEGWQFDHEDLRDLNIGPPIFGVNSENEEARRHGTAVLGIVAGTPHNGYSGLTAGLRLLKVASVRRNDGSKNIPGAITAASTALEPGDILLVEQQLNSGDPIETIQSVFDAIRLAVDAGRIVIEAGGDGHHPLDGGNNSGAILVGAVVSDLNGGGHQVHQHSNYGPKIDCYAWGDCVRSATVPALPLGSLLASLGIAESVVPAIEWPRANFPDTSASAAIIAGAVALIQGVARSRGRPLSPAAMRDLLRACSNTAVFDGEKRVGVMPDLKKILQSMK